MDVNVFGLTSVAAEPREVHVRTVDGSPPYLLLTITNGLGRELGHAMVRSNMEGDLVDNAIAAGLLDLRKKLG